jgi:hypothetical protein
VRASAVVERQRPAPRRMAAALLRDFRPEAAWVAGYLRCVLRAGGDGHRDEALGAVLAGLGPDELDRLTRAAGEAAGARRRAGAASP